MRVLNIIIFFMLTVFKSTTSFPASYPVEFFDFFAKKNEKVFLRLAGDSVGLKVDAHVSYEDFSLPDTSVASLRSYLSGMGLSDKAIAVITDQLVTGVPANPGCKVGLDVCSPEVMGRDIAYVFDYDNANLTIFVGSEWLLQQAEDVAYHPSLKENSALINQANAYLYADNASESSFSVSNDTTLGLPYGHVFLRSQYQDVDNSLDIYKGAYDFEFDNTRVLIGYIGADRFFFNTTDFLNSDHHYSAYSADIGSSRNLVRGGAAGVQVITFFAPQAGQLEVYQGERLLLTKVISQGRQSIYYSDLPAGSYDIILLVRTGGKKTLEERRQVVNLPQFSLPVYGWDYVFTTGFFDKTPDEKSLLRQSSVDEFSKNYAQFRTSFRATDNILLAGSVITNQHDQYIQAGVSYTFSDWLELNYQAGLFSTDDTYQAGTLRIGSLSLSGRIYDSDKNNKKYRLSSRIYNELSFSNYSAAYYSYVLGGTGYVAYNRYNKSEPSAQGNMLTSMLDDISVGWTTNWQNWQFGVNSSYSQNASIEDIKVGVTASYTLSNGATTQFSMTTDKAGSSRTEANVSKGIDIGNWSASGSTSVAWQPDMQKTQEATLSGVVSGQTDWANVSGYGYLNSADVVMVSGTLSGSQFISPQGAGMTNQRGTSFIHIVPTVVSETGSQSESLDGVTYNIRRGKNTAYQGRLSGGGAILPLTPYNETEFLIDADSRKLSVDNNLRKEFVYPGTVYTVEAQVTPLVSQLFVLNDIDGNPITQVRCVGDGCAGVEPVSSDGVFRVSYKAGSQFSLVSLNRLCINEANLKRGAAIYTYCLPGLISEEGRVAFSSNGPSQSSDILYLGKYESRKAANDLVGRLKEVGLTAKSVIVGNNFYLYVHYSNAFDVAQRSVLESLEAYIVLNDANVDKIFSTR